MASSPPPSAPAPFEQDTMTRTSRSTTNQWDSSSGAAITSSPQTLSPSSTFPSTSPQMLSPSSTFPSTSPASSPLCAEPKKQSTSFPFPFSLSRSGSKSKSRSKTPDPPPPPPPTPGLFARNTLPATLQHAQTDPSSRHTASHRDTLSKHPSAPATTSTTSPLDPVRRGGRIQKKSRPSGPAPGGYGRHSDDWLFGGFSLTMTARDIFGMGKKPTDEGAPGSPK